MKITSRIGALGLIFVLAGCESSSPKPQAHTSSSMFSSPSTHPTSTHKSPQQTCSADTAANHLNLQQQVGQLFMVGTPTASDSADLIKDISTYHVGGTFLFGHSQAPASVIAQQNARIQRAATTAATDGVKLLISTDQEGGLVQVLHGSGFSQMPNALTQAHLSPNALQTQATAWGRELKNAGITMNLAPVADNVLPQNTRANAPIGQLSREYGSTASATATYATAFAQGMAAAGITPASKHFPGLGNVRGNTDFLANVHDTTTTATDANLDSYVRSANAGHGFVMMSSAIYDRIDSSAPAVFSPKVVNLLRTKGFHGPVITDDFANARAVTRYPAGERAVRALNAGVDVLLLQDDVALPAMYKAVLDKAEHDPKFASTVKTAANAVLAAKESEHLLPASCS